MGPATTTQHSDTNRFDWHSVKVGDLTLVPVGPFALSKNISIITSSCVEPVDSRLTSRRKANYLDLRDAESALLLIAVLVGGLQHMVWELMSGLVLDYPSIQAKTRLNGLKWQNSQGCCRDWAVPLPRLLTSLSLDCLIVRDRF